MADIAWKKEKILLHFKYIYRWKAKRLAREYCADNPYPVLRRDKHIFVQTKDYGFC